MFRARIYAGISIAMWIGLHPLAQVGPAIEKAPEYVPYKPIGPHKTVHIQACPGKLDSETEPAVIHKVEPGVIPPKVVRMVYVLLTPQGQEAYRKGLFKDPNDVISRISVAVGTNGKPESPCLVSAAGFDLDEQAGNAAMQYLFIPAQKEEKAVAMRMILEFRYETH